MFSEFIFSHTAIICLLGEHEEFGDTTEEASEALEKTFKRLVCPFGSLTFSMSLIFQKRRVNSNDRFMHYCEEQQPCDLLSSSDVALCLDWAESAMQRNAKYLMRTPCEATQREHDSYQV
jgi:hypothetical protein